MLTRSLFFSLSVDYWKLWLLLHCLIVGALDLAVRYNQSVENVNIVFVKGGKVGGSTVGGVVRRICTHYNLHSCKRANTLIDIEPGIWANHSPLENLLSSINVLQKPVFLMTWVRDPIERSMSRFYFLKVSRGGIESSIENKIEFLSSLENDPQANLISGRSEPAMEDDVPTILAQYDFVGVTERFEESMLLLAWKLNLSICDIMYLKAKDSQSRKKDDRGVELVPHLALSDEPVEVQQYLTGDGFRSRNAADFEVLQVVNKAMNEAIEQIGSSVFARALSTFHTALDKAAIVCPATISPSNCYWNDNGCGYPCLDALCEASPERMLSPFPFSEE